VTIYDPWIHPEEVKREYGLDAITTAPDPTFDAIVHAVAHKEFSILDLTTFKNEKAIIYDVKGVLETGVNGKL
jgi:UDP-N-acetyl-D-galactosamine dehydrogenase